MAFDVEFARSCFPAFAEPSLQGWANFENAGGSYAVGHTIDALHHFYAATKVQTHGRYPASAAAGEAMDHSHRRWAEALGVEPDEVHFGPSTSANTYVLANALGETLGPNDVVVVTNQDHEANSGVFRRMADRAGATIREWRVDPQSGLLAMDDLDVLLDDRVAVVCAPHSSNIVGSENDIAAITARARDLGAISIVDGVSAAPHGIPDIGALGCDVYLFSLYKVFSVHQGLMTVARALVDRLPNQGHEFNAHLPAKRLTPAGPDHAQVAAAAAVLDYIVDTASHHGADGPDLGSTARAVAALWQGHEQALAEPILATLAADDRVRLLGPTTATGPVHRSPTIAFDPRALQPNAVVDRLVDAKIMASAGSFYARRTLHGLGVDPDRGVVRLSFVHYTTPREVDQLLDGLARALE